MAYTAIDDPEAYFQVKTYTGDGSTQSLTLDGDTDMQPDLVWIKNRDEDYEQTLFDSVRGVTKFLRSSTYGGEQTNTDTLTAFGSDGFSVGSDGSVNDNTDGFVAWCWKESATSGFDIVTYTGNATARTISHSLSAVPRFYVVKSRDTNGLNWEAYHAGIASDAETDFLYLDTTGAATDQSNAWNDTAPTSSVFSLGDGTTPNKDGDDYVAYLFAPKQGFSKFGSYTGNGDADGPFVFTGFRPAFVMTKSIAAGEGWVIRDNKRNTYNVVANHLRADGNTTESSATGIYADFLSNGFKMRGTDAAISESGTEYIYMAFAEAPLVNSEGVPGNAR